MKNQHETDQASTPAVTRPVPGSLPATVALTGATGFLGSHIADLLITAGTQVRASIRATSNLRWLAGADIQKQQIDLLDSGQATAFIDGAGAVIHCAGVTSAPDQAGYFRGNVETTRTLLSACTDSGSCHTFLYISSLAAAGPGTPADPVDEKRPCRPLTTYGRSKLAAEQEILDNDWPFRTVILRPPALYGPRDPEFLPLFKLAQRGWTVRLGNSISGLSLVDGRDTAVAAVALLQAESASGPYFVDDGHAYTMSDLAAALGRTFNRTIRTLPIPVGPLKFAAAVLGQRLADKSVILNSDRLADMTAPGWVCSGERLRRDTGFTAVRNLERGFADTLAFYREIGWIQ